MYRTFINSSFFCFYQCLSSSDESVKLILFLPQSSSHSVFASLSLCFSPCSLTPTVNASIHVNVRGALSAVLSVYVWEMNVNQYHLWSGNPLCHPPLLAMLDRTPAPTVRETLCSSHWAVTNDLSLWLWWFELIGSDYGRWLFFWYSSISLIKASALDFPWLTGFLTRLGLIKNKKETTWIVQPPGVTAV